MVKLEEEDQLEVEYGPSNKKTKIEWNNVAEIAPTQSLQNSLLVEPSPLGLRLRKSPSLLDLIQMRLSQENSTTSSCATSNLRHEAGKKKDLKSTDVSGTTDKLKASNFPASLLRIGTWERVSRYEGDLVAKCYYAKHKLVWEILDGGLKSKIEIQWSDITGLKATYSDSIPETLNIVLARQPLFFREINPQPRKHTLWQATSDFTNGQASIHRRHFLKCPPGMLNRHFEKLIQCDARLKSLSQQSEIILESPYFDPRSSMFEDHDESNKCHGYEDLKGGFGSKLHVLKQDNFLASPTPSTSYNNEITTPMARTSDNLPMDFFSPSSETNSTTIKTEEQSINPSYREQMKIYSHNSSTSTSDLMTNIIDNTSEKTTPGNPLFEIDSSESKFTLEEVTQRLLSESQLNSASDEQSLMSKINSFCCLIQHEESVVDVDTSDSDDESRDSEADDNKEEDKENKLSISRKESYGELLMNLPRIQSMPQFLCNISKDSKTRAQ